jgi:hypothetical protein
MSSVGARRTVNTMSVTIDTSDKSSLELFPQKTVSGEIIAVRLFYIIS